MKRINLLWIDDKDVHYPMDELNPARVESLDRRQALLDFFKLAQRFGVKIVSPRTPYGMNECLGPTLV